MLGVMDPTARARAIAFLTAIDDRCAQRPPACPGGHANRRAGFAGAGLLPRFLRA
jgi:hypothetical protein